MLSLLKFKGGELEVEVTVEVAEEAEGLLDVFCVGGFRRKADAI